MKSNTDRQLFAEILSTGEEVRTGAIIDTNAAEISRRLEESGVEVTRHHTVGDDPKAIADTIREISARADLAVATGGLGPTDDDRTVRAAADAAGVELRQDPAALRSVESFFVRRGIAMNPANRKQAELPEGARCLENPVGTAPGFTLTIGKCRWYVLPGVPGEMRRMLDDQVIPRINETLETHRRFRKVRTVTTYGLTESRVNEQLSGFTDDNPGVRIGTQLHFPEIHIRLFSEGDAAETVADRLRDAAAWICDRFGTKVLSTRGKTMAAAVGELLTAQRASVAVAESCTGGLIAHLLTEVPGSSRYFLFSAVAYANEAKIRVLGVSPRTLEAYGAVHEETVMEMAAGAKRQSGAVYAVSTSGVAGPGGGTDEKPVGTICIGVAGPYDTDLSAKRFCLSFDDRTLNKQIFAVQALNQLRLRLLQSASQIDEAPEGRVF